MTTGRSLSRLGDAVRTYRVLSGFTQEEIVRRGGPSDVTLRGLEYHNGRPPSGSTLRKLDIGLGWPAGVAEKIFRGDADVIKTTENGVERPALVDFTNESGVPVVAPEGDPKAEGMTSGCTAQCLTTESTPELLTELAARYRGQATQIRGLKQEIATLRKEVERWRTPDAPSAP